MKHSLAAPLRPRIFQASRSGWCGLCALLLLGTAVAGRAALQFDVFLGYDDTAREAGWFPVACEVFNDGPTFNAVFELSNENTARGQSRQVLLELPTNTRKRFVIPVFGSGRYSSWTGRLLDDRGRVRAERTGMRTRDRAWESFLMGAVPRSFAGLPTLPDVKTRQEEFQPKIARLQADHFPDNPIALEGLDVLYLNSEKALELKAPQRTALLAWLYGGGHLVLAVEQPTDVNGTPWLRGLVPCDLTAVRTIQPQSEIHNWLRSTPEIPDKTATARRPARTGGRNPPNLLFNPFSNLPDDLVFDQADMPVASGVVRDGQVVLGAQGVPLVIKARRGRGQITVLTFSPEREPFRSWKNRAWFWARIAEVPPAWLTPTDVINRYGGMSIDGVIGAMIDSRQVRKLPVTWLLLLLLVYLAVIGPLDQYWLKRINRQMLTWLTFPAYVALFSGLIYFIGYKLRAGETEWNELHLVDILPMGEQAQLRGRTYASIYSPVNAKYELVSDQPHATLRGEFQGSWGGGVESSRASVEQRGRGFRAEVFVPVWTSQLFVSDWLQLGDPVLGAKVVAQRNGQLLVEVENRSDRKLADARLVAQGRVFDLGDLTANQTKRLTLNNASGKSLSQFVDQFRQQFFDAVQQRRQALGRDRSARLDRQAVNVVAVSFVSQIDDGRNDNRYFMAPSGFDVSQLVERGDALVFAWAPGQSPAKAINRFSPRRSQRDTMWRLSVPITTEN
jgi:hypothetical protein